MELGTKTACTASKSSEKASLDGLKERQVLLQERLRAGLDAGDADTIIETRRQLAELKVRLPAAEVAALRHRQQELEVELETNDEAAKLLNQALTVARLELEEAQLVYQPFIDRYNRIQTEKSLVDNKRQLLLGSSRETRAKLFKLTEQMKA